MCKGNKNNNYKHGLSDTRFYRIRKCINDRCYNEEHKQYKNYGGKGIRNYWKNFCEFKKEMYESYLIHCNKFGEENTTIERERNNSGYYESNCKWATKQEQARNRTSNILYKGKCLKDWCCELGLNYNTIKSRLNYGWSIEKALNTKIGKRFGNK